MRTSSALITVAILALLACTPTQPVDKQQLLQDYSQVKAGKDPVHGEETAMWYGSIEGVNGTNANGVGFIRRYEDGATVVTVNLNILPAEEGTHFQAFITDGAGTSVDAGELRSIIGDARHSAKLETKDDVSALLTVEVHSVKGGLLAGQSSVVARGTLKQPAAK